MKKKTAWVLAILLGVITVFLPLGSALSAAADIPSGYVIYDGSAYFLLDYEDLLDSYVAYSEDAESEEARMAKFYFDTLAPGFDDHFIAYVSGVTNKFVSFASVLDKYIETENVSETYGWFNSAEATSAFGKMTEVKILGADGSVTGSVVVGKDGYELVNAIPNPSVEKADANNPGLPDKWAHNSWGNNTAVFNYPVEGHSGAGVKVTVSGYKDGDAKWFFEPIALAPRDYVFSDYYSSNTDSRVVLAVTDNGGAIRYIDLPMVPASEGWTKYEAAFTMPSDGVSVTVYHLLSRNGYLITDDYCIYPYSFEGFDRGLVTITFDDGWEENTLTALPIMKQHGFVSNQFYATTYIETPWGDPELIRQFINEGHEIGSHSVTHRDLTTLPEADAIWELEESKRFLEEKYGISVRFFATPYGAYNEFVKNGIMERYGAHRTVDSGYNSKDNFDAGRLKCMSVLNTTTADEVEEWVKKAKEEKLWLILLYHRVANNPGPYDTTPEMFAEHMQVIDDYDLPVVTMSQALEEIGKQ